VITIVGGYVSGDTISLSVGDTFTAPTATAVDDVDGVLLLSPSSNVDMSIAESYTVTYAVSDAAGNAASALLNVMVSAQVSNTPPVGVNDTFTTAVNTPIVLSFADLTANDTDVDNDSLMILLADDWINGIAAYDAVAETITFTPATDFTGDATFTYALTDGHANGDWGLMGYAVVTIQVGGSAPPAGSNTAPIAVDDNDPSTTRSGEVLIIQAADLIANDTDAENDTLTISAVTNGTNVSVELIGQEVHATPSASFVGVVSFGYTVSDGQATSPATVSFTIPAVLPPSQGAFETAASTNRFFAQATFGAKKSDIENFTGQSASAWFLVEMGKEASTVLPILDAFRSGGTPDNIHIETRNDISYRLAFLKNAMGGDDQLRQRMALALSEILVTSDQDTFLFNHPRALGYYQDLLINQAFGNYRELLEAVTYSPAMGEYLTYAGNQKSNPVSGRTPDENYAREIMQLFTIGVIELEQNGDPVLDADGNAIEAYSNRDVTGLASVFTGLHHASPNFDSPLLDTAVEVRPMSIFPDFHSDSEKTFLGQTIPPNTGGVESIDLALDALVEHPNTAPFISRQLIQRFVTSQPSSDYIERASQAFALGRYTLPDGSIVGDGRRGDLAATIASILFDREARNMSMRDDPRFGKIREPLIRFIHWARAFDAQNITPEFVTNLFNTRALGQQVYGSSSVFNFFRPGYIAPGTDTGSANITAPELQITTSSSIPAYVNFMGFFTSQLLRDLAGNEVATEEEVRSSLIANYTQELELAGQPEELVDSLDSLLTYGFMSAETKSNITAAIATIPLDDSGRERRVFLAVLMVMASADYIIQR
jgi:uncharacterized protein (DUF1800 family)